MLPVRTYPANNSAEANYMPADEGFPRDGKSRIISQRAADERGDLDRITEAAGLQLE
jgi:hypothetical protein